LFIIYSKLIITNKRQITQISIFWVICLHFLKLLADIISGYFPFALLILCGLYLSFKGRFFQFGKFFDSIKITFKAFRCKEKGKGGISSFQSACTALSATVGTGNIAGVAGALSIGGAGAVFWMWISAFLGMAIKYAEIKLAIIYRENNGKFKGGPMYYIKNGMPSVFKPFSFIYALAAIPAVFCTGNITQTNSAVLSVGESPLIRVIMGVIFTVLTTLVVWGGSSRIGAVTEKIVPIMSVIYIVLSFCIILMNGSYVPVAFAMILKGAFAPRAVTGGAVGSVLAVIITGASRGIFSNEAGLGSSAMAHAVAFDANSETQGLFGIFEVFLDTVVICTLTALTILCSGVNIEYGSIASAELVQGAISLCFGRASHYMITVMMCIFGFSSVIGWAFYGNLCWGFLFGSKGEKIFIAIYPFFCLLGAILNTSVVWDLAEFFNGIMLCVNLPVLIYLSGAVLTERKEINDRSKTKENKRFFAARRSLTYKR